MTHIRVEVGGVGITVGTAGECFYMRHSQVWAPAPLRRVRTVVSRLKRLRRDPWRDYWTCRQRVTKTLLKAVAA